MIKSSQDTVTLPSGTQCRDRMQHLHEELWKLQSGSRKKVKVREFDKMKDAGEEVKVVNEVLAAGANKAGAPPPAGSSGPTPTATREKEGAPTSAGNPVDTADEERLVEIFLPMPKNWLHRQSLVYVMFGKISQAPDVDLDLAMSDGPTNRKRKTNIDFDVGSTADGESSSRASPGLLSKRAVKRLAAPNESNSRAKHKKLKEEQARTVHAHGFRDKVLEALQNPPTAKDHGELVSCVKTFAASMIDNNRIKEREHKIECLKEEIALLKDMGEMAEARDIQRELRALLKQPYRPNVLPAGVDAGGGTGDGSKEVEKGSVDATNIDAAVTPGGSALGGVMLPTKGGVGIESHGGGRGTGSGIGASNEVDGGGDAMEDGLDAVIDVTWV